ncbi:cytochrome P450 [Paracoccus sp. (in: a-proteobacteria)]|uniref:cytochrome P450 n=1 Tax=Paracoccus sp. TaxID=267 RepID=UPI0026E00580|nr:cytochrome P450 [Paracoccus sp. (in: a-proteobacteria)]MDO5648600.1 cytochrome P450 [Paracoccus sp. (in: a-proteobacteria)]
MFDPSAADFGENPWPAYAALRAQPGLPFWPEFDGVLASRMADVRAIAVDRRMVRAAAAFMTPEQAQAQKIAANFHDMPYHERFVQTSMLDTDGPDHDRLRRAVFPFFTKTRLESLRGFVTDWVEQRLDHLIPLGRFDFIADLAALLPAQVIGHLIGTDPDRAPDMTRWSDDVVSYFDIDRTAAKKARAEDSTRLFHDLLIALERDRRAAPRDDLMTAIIAVQDSGGISHDELIATIMQILHAGHGSTTDALGSGMAALMAHPDQMALLRAHPDLMPQAVQEMFRYAAPLPFFHRFASQDITVAGQDWPRGTKFGLLYASANRDGAAFADADRFDVTRHPNLHLGFGAGPHVCLGNNLARLNMGVLFTALLARVGAIEPDGPAEWKTGLQAHGPTRLPVRVR